MTCQIWKNERNSYKFTLARHLRYTANAAWYITDQAPRSDFAINFIKLDPASWHLRWRTMFHPNAMAIELLKRLKIGI